MAIVEIMSPMSETCAQTTFNVVGEHDLARFTKEKKGPIKIKCYYRDRGVVGDTWHYHSQTDPLNDGTWTCPMTLTSGHNYDIQAVIYEGDQPMVNSPPDEVDNIMVMAMPPIIITPPPPPGGPARLAAGRLIEGMAPPHNAQTDPNRIVCYLFRRSKKNNLTHPVAVYTETVWASDGSWYLKDGDIKKLFRPEGGDGEKLFVLLVTIIDEKKKIKKNVAASIALGR